MQLLEIEIEFKIKLDDKYFIMHSQVIVIV